MNIDQQIADIRSWLCVAIDQSSAAASLDMQVLAIKARAQISKRIHFKARSEGQKNRWKKVRDKK